MKKSVFPILAVAVLFLLLTHPALSFEGASRGLVLWYQTVLPTLLPFMICSKMIVSLGGIRLLTAPAAPLLKPVLRLSDGGCYVLVSGLLCGYPMGARNCGEFVKEGRISASEGRYLLSISNHPSPMFLLGYMAAAADPSIPLGLLLIAVYLPVIPIAFLSRHVYHVSEGTARNPLFQENRLSVSGPHPLDIEQERIVPTVPERLFILAYRDDLSLQNFSARSHAVFPAGLGKAHRLIADGEFPMNTGRADKGPPALLLDKITLAAKLLHRPPDSDAADGIFCAEFRLGWDLLFRLVFSVLNGGFDIVLYLLI